ncbi:unnamed protein product [Phaeothamnion confervicola]
MSAIAGGLRRLWDALFAVTFALAGFQLPAFLAVYRHRLDQSALELDRQLAAMRASPTPDASSIARIEATVPELRRAVEALGGSGIGRLRAFAEHFDWPVVQAALGLHEPNLPLTLEAALYAAGAAILGLFVAAATAGLARAVFLPRRISEHT